MIRINSAIPIIIHVVRIVTYLAIPIIICITLMHIIARFDFAIVIHFAVAHFRICFTIRVVIYFIIVHDKIFTLPVVIHLVAGHFATAIEQALTTTCWIQVSNTIGMFDHRTSMVFRAFL